MNPKKDKGARKPTSGREFQAKEEQTKRTAALAAHVAKSWTGPGPAPGESELAALRITVIAAICALPESVRTRVIDSHPTSVVQKLARERPVKRRARRWICCRGDVFNQKKWRKMIICIFIVMGVTAFVAAAFKTVLLLFDPDLRILRKLLHMVAPAREHSFGFVQVCQCAWPL